VNGEWGEARLPQGFALRNDRGRVKSAFGGFGGFGGFLGFVEFVELRE